jgi:hypothetical protein
MQAFLLPYLHFKSGTEEHGTYESELHIPRWNCEEGVYKLQYVMLVDRHGTATYLEPQSFQATFSTQYV